MASGVKTITKPEETKDIPDSKLLETDEYRKELIELAGLKLPEFTDDDFDEEEDESIPEKMKKINEFISERFGDILSSDDKEEIIDFVKKTIFDCEEEEDEEDDRNIYSENEKINKILQQEREEFQSIIDRELTRVFQRWRDGRLVSLKSYQNKDKNVYDLCYDGCYYCYYVCYVGRKGYFYRAYMFRTYIPKPYSCLPIVNNKNILDYCDIKEEILKNRE
jgi:DNA gyrase/topoisomerase IV subunit A